MAGRRRRRWLTLGRRTRPSSAERGEQTRNRRYSPTLMPTIDAHPGTPGHRSRGMGHRQVGIGASMLFVPTFATLATGDLTRRRFTAIEPPASIFAAIATHGCKSGDAMPKVNSRVAAVLF